MHNILISKSIEVVILKSIAVKVGARIRYFRLMKELSQEKLALEAGINPAFLGHIERGLKCPTIDTLSKISMALNVTLSELVKIEEENSNDDLVLNKIMLSLKTLSDEDANRVAHIVAEMIKLNTK